MVRIIDAQALWPTLATDVARACAWLHSATQPTRLGLEWNLGKLARNLRELEWNVGE